MRAAPAFFILSENRNAAARISARRRLPEINRIKPCIYTNLIGFIESVKPFVAASRRFAFQLIPNNVFIASLL